MSQRLSNSVTEIQARSMVQGDRALGVARGLRGQVRDRVGRPIEDPNRQDEVLRKRIDELVGMTFYGTLLKTMRDSALKAPYGHGGRGEEVFRGQLDLLLAERMGRAQRFDLNEAIYRSLTQGSKATSTGSRIS